MGRTLEAHCSFLQSSARVQVVGRQGDNNNLLTTTALGQALVTVTQMQERPMTVAQRLKHNGDEQAFSSFASRPMSVCEDINSSVSSSFLSLDH